jgi:hypothetical protein
MAAAAVLPEVTRAPVPRHVVQTKHVRRTLKKRVGPYHENLGDEVSYAAASLRGSVGE